jgi:7,8-dihydropterin-6-yl-methyl-4-(beta-D-ribofuranosyl)aminobenzene 5'-phosphate synthase
MTSPGLARRARSGVGRCAALAVILFTAGCFGSENHKELGEKDSIVVTIIYDNYEFDDRFKTACGFACVVTSGTDTVLFDTGGDGDLLLSNMSVSEFDPTDMDAVVISHIHADHTGGLDAFLRVNSDVDVFIPKTFPDWLKGRIRTLGARIIETEEPCKVCEKVWTTGVLNGRIDEQGLSVKTSSGLIVITGCAHPGILHMAQAAQRYAALPVKAVLGGFHLGGASASEIADLIHSLKELGVTRVAPCHCSGDQTRRLMSEAFGEGYLPSGAGARLVFAAQGRAQE